MADHRNLARPYAKAVFELSVQQKNIMAWSQLLALLAQAAKEPCLKALYNDPRYTSQQLTEVFFAVLSAAKMNDKQYENFVLLLAQYRRLPLLPLIAELFEEDRAQQEKTQHVFVTSAFPIDMSLQQRLQHALEARLGSAVVLQLSIDKSLLGGLIIRAGDLVIDGSVRRKLSKLKYALMR